MSIKIRMYSILNDDKYGDYVLDYTGNEVKLENTISIVRDAKRKFKIPCKKFILVANDTCFFVCKVRKEWKSYEFKGVESEQNI